jgi:hypothetical protein
MSLTQTMEAGISRRQFEDNLRREKADHLRQIEADRDAEFQPCLHDGCSECHGTGKKRDGSGCVHMISCPCPKCTPRC